jgi:ATP-dependent DNA helicase RecG
MLGLDASLRTAVGAKTATPLEEAFGLRRVRDLLAHYPRRYVRFGGLSDLADLEVGDHVTVVAEVISRKQREMRNRRGNIVEAVISDGRQHLTLTFFKQRWRYQQLAPGVRGQFAGRLSLFNGVRQLAHPTCLLFPEGMAEPDPGPSGIRVTPIYPASSKIDSWQIQLAVSTVLTSLGELPDPMPEAMRIEQGLASYDSAIRTLHQPPDLEDIEPARTRLKWDEAFGLQVALAQRRATARAYPAAPRPGTTGALLDEFDAGLPYVLTDGQREVGAQIGQELGRDVPMNRLLAGEVGSGKTVVALRAMLQVVDSGGQAAMLAPTEVLAGQHLRSIRELLGPIGRAGELDGAPDATRVVLLTGSQGAAARRDALAEVASGEAGIVVGTHALLSEGVAFHDLGLVVVDEQHRFGVEQRAALRERARAQTSPHLLVMTATPIPRTVAMTVFGDLESSELIELPRGRQPIATSVVPDDKPHWVARMWEKIRDECAGGRQAFVVCPRIEPGTADDTADDTGDDTAGPGSPDGDEPGAVKPAAAVEQVGPVLAAGELAGLRVEMLHGRMPGETKDAVMRRFAAGDTDVLVATTVIEVGVDVPNATVMVVLDADRFGISQLHQLRGRIGRGSHPSTCLLHTALPDAAPARERLDVVASTTDGAALAREDLRLRGEGDVLGAAQHGVRGQLKLLRLIEDEEIVVASRAYAQRLVTDDPRLAGHPALAAAVAVLEGDAAHLEKG